MAAAVTEAPIRGNDVPIKIILKREVLPPPVDTTGSGQIRVVACGDHPECWDAAIGEIYPEDSVDLSRPWHFGRIEVPEKLRRQGVATAMYLAADSYLRNEFSASLVPSDRLTEQGLRLWYSLLKKHDAHFNLSAEFVERLRADYTGMTFARLEQEERNRLRGPRKRFLGIF